MILRQRQRVLAAGMASILALAAPGTISAQTAQAAPPQPVENSSASALSAGVGTVTHLAGTLSVKRPDGSTRFLSTKSHVGEGDILSTASGTYARVKFEDGAEVVLRPESQLKVEAYKFNQQKPSEDSSVLSMLKGGLRSVTGLLGKRSRDKVSIVAPNATIGIRGTHFGMLLCQGDCGAIPTITGKPPENGLHLDVADGSIVVRNPAGQQQLNAGQFGFVRDAQTPPIQVPPQQGIQVTMPPAISKNEAGGRSIGKERKDDECTVR